VKQGKTWGETWCIFKTPLMELHRLEVHPGGYCSVHEHEHKWNGFYVERGELLVKVWQPSKNSGGQPTLDQTRLGPGDSLIVQPGVEHQFVGLTACVAFEAYSINPLTEDIVRKSTGGSLTPAPE
jgi:mannose-6-phosphate isomerase-like protein (cupin superfamily)